jgi:hypothetical protein
MSTQGSSYDSRTGDDIAAAALPRQRKHSSSHVVNRPGNAHSVCTVPGNERVLFSCEGGNAVILAALHELVLVI